MEQVKVTGGWQSILQDGQKPELEKALPGHLMAARWFGGKARTIEGVRISDVVPLASARTDAYIAVLDVAYADGGSQCYVLPLTFAPGEEGKRVASSQPRSVLLEIATPSEQGVLYDASWNERFACALLDAIKAGATFPGPNGDVVASSTKAFARLEESAQESLDPSVSRAQQSNTSIIYGRTFILKLFRRLEEGISPDLEIGRFLVDRNFKHTPPVAGALELGEPGEEPRTLAILQGFVPNRGDAWQYTLDSLLLYFDRVGSFGAGPEGRALQGQHLLDLAEVHVPANVGQALGSYLESARLLGRRTAELHVVLASNPNDPAFAPEPFTMDYQRSLYDSMQALTSQAFDLLDRRRASLPEAARATARQVLEQQGDVRRRFGALLDRELSAMRTRCHGDYHLGQILYTGDDFVIIDFEGEPVRSLAERRLKQSPLKDVAGMLRSFHYAAFSALFDQLPAVADDPAEARRLEACANAWHTWVGATFLKEYLRVASQASFLPQSHEELRSMLDLYALEKAVYELVYELNNRPGWVRIPLQGIAQLLE